MVHLQFTRLNDVHSDKRGCLIYGCPASVLHTAASFLTKMSCKTYCSSRAKGMAGHLAKQVEGDTVARCVSMGPHSHADTDAVM